MPFTEDNLRTVLADRSYARVPATDLAATAERRGKRIRRRRRAAAAALTVSAVVGVVAAPSVLHNAADQREDGALAGGARQPGPVDMSVFQKPQPAPNAMFTERLERGGMGAVVAGRVKGFSEGTRAPNASVPRPANTVSMEVTVERWLQGATLANGSVQVMVGGDAASSVDRFRQAVPNGTRMIAFLTPAQGQTDNLLQDLAGRALWAPQGLIFESHGPAGVELLTTFGKIRLTDKSQAMLSASPQRAAARTRADTLADLASYDGLVKRLWAGSSFICASTLRDTLTAATERDLTLTLPPYTCAELPQKAGTIRTLCPDVTWATLPPDPRGLRLKASKTQLKCVLGVLETPPGKP